MKIKTNIEFIGSPFSYELKYTLISYKFMINLRKWNEFRFKRTFDIIIEIENLMSL
jgi:hypothetical protein